MDFLESARLNGADGLLLSKVMLDKHDRLKQLTEAGMPYVIVGASYDDRSLPCVAVDNTGGMESAVRHLVERGHRRIGLINLDLDGPDHNERWRAFQQTMDGLGVAIDLRLLLLHGHVLPEDVAQAVRNWFNGGLPPFTAIIACGGLEGMAAMRVLSERGCRVPDDVSLVSFDDYGAAAMQNPPMTVIRQPLLELGRRSVEKLIEAIRADRMPEGTEILPTQLIARESTRAITS